MKNLKPRTFIVYTFAAISGVILLNASQQVQEAQGRLDTYEKSIENEEEQIRMLRAEWASLNRPERLERLANEYLDLLPPAPDQMMDRQMPTYVVDDSEDDFEPVLQPVSVKGAPPPKPQVKPQVKPNVPSKKTREAEAEEPKDFDALMGEIGGDQ